MPELLLLKQKYPDAKIIVGNTEVGVEQKFRFAKYPNLISPQLVSQMHQWKVEADGIIIGSAVVKRCAESTAAVKAFAEEIVGALNGR